jgi:hypothetical protein
VNGEDYIQELCNLYFSSLFGVMIDRKSLNWIMLNKHITLEIQVLMGKLLQCIFTQYNVELGHSYS